MRVDEFHTFDENDISKPSRAKRGLIGLSGNVAGHNLTICKPYVAAPELTLVPREGKEKADGEQAEQEAAPTGQ
jgi:hypothetical protein